MNSLELTSAVTAIANAIACKLTPAQLTLATIAAVCSKEEKSAE